MQLIEQNEMLAKGSNSRQCSAGELDKQKQLVSLAEK